jgi:2-dehydropantoate 2-reductase
MRFVVYGAGAIGGVVGTRLLDGESTAHGEVAGRPRGGGSSWQSLMRGTGTVEADQLNGEIVLLGRLHGVPAPANDLVRRLVNRAARDRTPPGSLTPAELSKMLED